jgi:high-affinity iron transporter
MLSSAIIVFREVFEIVLILGIVLAATRDIAHRKKAIIAGFAGGVAGSLLVAAFIEQISNFSEGMGQEIFNASVLFVAALFIGWTLIWMKRHASGLHAHFAGIGQAVSDGRLPLISISIVIALALLREGSEIVLFTYGMLAAGQSVFSIVTGSIVGLVAGLLLGTLLYAGLIKLSMKIFFRVTGILLMLLIAGMVSQGFGLLASVGMFSNLSNTVWDSSWLLNDGSIVGEGLGAIVGYTARPMMIQLLAYIATLGFLVLIIKYFENADTKVRDIKKTVKAAILLAGCAALMLALSTQANATKTVTSPYVERGEKEIEYKFGYDFDDDDDKDGAWKEKLAFGYGVNDFWATEIEVEAAHSGKDGADTELAVIAWENKFQLTGKGEYWVDVGLKAEYKYNTGGGNDSAKVKFLFAKDTGDFSHKLNLNLSRSFTSDSPDGLKTDMAWGTKYRYDRNFNPGIELYNEFGSFTDGDSSNEQKRRIGPAFYGQITDRVGYEIGYLFGLTDATPDGTLKVVLEYEW